MSTTEQKKLSRTLKNNNMKQLLILLFLFKINLSYAQMIGDTRSTVLELQSGSPCDVRANVLFYCPGGNNRIMYTFNSRDYLSSISKATFVSMETAQYLLDKKLKSYSTKPLRNNDEYVFLIDGSLAISYAIRTDSKYGVYFWEHEVNSDLL